MSNTPQSAVRPGGRTARTSDAIREAAAALLSEIAPGDLTVAMIADRAGVNPTTIYRKWGTKDALLGDVLLTLSGTQLAAPDSGSLRADLVAVMDSVAGFLRTPAGFALMRFGAATDGRTSDALRDTFWSDRLGRARVILERAAERGEEVDVDAGLLAYEAMIGAMHFRLLERRKPLPEETPERLVDLMLPGIRKRPATAQE